MLKALLLFFILVFCKISFSQKNSLNYQIRYQSNKHQLSKQHIQLLQVIYDTLIDKNNYIIYINGHADADADSSFNQQLSLKRSLGVKDFFVEKGIDQSLIKVQANGEAQPLITNSTPIAKAKNRRVEILVLFAKESFVQTAATLKLDSTNSCKKDTTVELNEGYKLVLSVCDWEKNKNCLKVTKKLNYKIRIKKNWLKQHIGFKKHSKIIGYEPHYQFLVVACEDSCFNNKIKLYIPQYAVPGLKISNTYTQKKNNKNKEANLKFRKTKLKDSAYYVTEIYCPGMIDCFHEYLCPHPINVYAKNKIELLSYTYYKRYGSSFYDSIIQAKPKTNKLISESYTNVVFKTLILKYKGDTITLNNIPIEVLAHGSKKIKRKINNYGMSYFLFIPYLKKVWCGHYKKYKIRAKDLENLKNFNLFDLPIIDELEE